uniref:Uncharacterized protein n=1 Tax=Anguilla anguilla TaxID=7936 RepID=A0A0E9PJ11_ANGAN
MSIPQGPISLFPNDICFVHKQPMALMLPHTIWCHYFQRRTL